MRPRAATNRLAAFALVAAVGLGLAGRVAVHEGARLPHGDALVALGRAAVALGAPWLAAAWAIGAMSGSRSRGARAGGAALALGTAAWYLLTVVANGHVAYALAVAAAWFPLALAAGALFGFAGGVWSDGTPRARAVSIAALAGCLAGEALLLAGEWPGRAAQLILGLELAAAIGLLALARRRAPLAVTLAVFALAALACAGAEAGAHHVAQLAGWNGPTL
jgi:uncharacterized protein DUF6518